jgi:hypothetical protein
MENYCIFGTNVRYLNENYCWMKRSMIFAKSPKSMIIKIMRVPYDLSVKINYLRMK